MYAAAIGDRVKVYGRNQEQYWTAHVIGLKKDSIVVVYTEPLSGRATTIRVEKDHYQKYQPN
jgi:hypothetical protein